YRARDRPVGDGSRRAQKRGANTAQLRAAVDRLCTAGVTITEGCRVMGISRSTYYANAQSHSLKRESEAALRSAIENVVAEWPAYGYRRVTHELRRRGIVVNHKRVAR